MNENAKLDCLGLSEDEMVQLISLVVETFCKSRFAFPGLDVVNQEIITSLAEKFAEFEEEILPRRGTYRCFTEFGRGEVALRFYWKGIDTEFAPEFLFDLYRVIGEQQLKLQAWQHVIDKLVEAGYDRDFLKSFIRFRPIGEVTL